MTLVDTHCHLYSPKFKDDLDNAVTRARESGISKIFLPAIDTESHAALIELSEKKYEGMEILPMMGLHPCSIKQNFEDELAVVRKYLDGDKKFYAVGEIGLDYYWDGRLQETKNYAPFERQIEWSIEKNLPIVIHSRSSTPHCIKSVSNMPAGLRAFSIVLAERWRKQGKLLKPQVFIWALAGWLPIKTAT